MKVRFRKVNWSHTHLQPTTSTQQFFFYQTNCNLHFTKNPIRHKTSLSRNKLHPKRKLPNRPQLPDPSRLVLASPKDTEAKDFEAHAAFAFMAPCRLLLLQGSVNEVNNCIARFM